MCRGSDIGKFYRLLLHRLHGRAGRDPVLAGTLMRNISSNSLPLRGRFRLPVLRHHVLCGATETARPGQNRSFRIRRYRLIYKEGVLCLPYLSFFWCLPHCIFLPCKAGAITRSGKPSAISASVTGAITTSRKFRNSLPAFRRAIDHGWGAELDVHLLKDGTLAVFHDSDLSRCAGVSGMIEDLTLPELKSSASRERTSKSRSLTRCSRCLQNAAPLIIELKSANGNHYALTNAVTERLDSYKGEFCIESFDPFCVLDVKKLRPRSAAASCR